jgi:hypothetical protein
LYQEVTSRRAPVAERKSLNIDCGTVRTALRATE